MLSWESSPPNRPQHFITIIQQVLLDGCTRTKEVAPGISPSSGRHTHACSKLLRLQEKEQKGSPPGGSHPSQITICTRHLRTEPSRWRENKQTENREELGKWGLVVSGCSQVPLSGCQRYRWHDWGWANLKSMAVKNKYIKAANQSGKVLHRKRVLEHTDNTR